MFKAGAWPAVVNQMRVIAGELRRRRLKGAAAGYRHLRPTSDKVRESVFNLLRDRIRDTRFLDLYAGTGAMGIEAVSRGAAHVTFVEMEHESLRILRQNVGDLKIEHKCDVVQMDVAAYLDAAARGGRKFDIIFADPPYDAGFVEMLMDKPGAGALLDEHGLFVLEQRSRPLEENAGQLVLDDVRKYGKTQITLWTPTRSTDPNE